MVKIVDINENNIDEQGLFCKKTKKDLPGYQKKKKWIKDRFKEGLKYKVLYVKEGNKETSRGMIEYIPGKYNWRGIKADGWMVIHCLWVVGKHKEKGYGSQLVNLALKDAKDAGLCGIVGMTAEKGGWLPKKALYEKLGFKLVDEQEPHFQLYIRAFSEDAPEPKFHPFSQEKLKQYSSGVTIFYSDQCPYIIDLVDEIKDMDDGNKAKIVKFNKCKEAQENAIYPYGSYFVVCDGERLLYQHSLKKTIEATFNK